jgi:hypothetical protein
MFAAAALAAGSDGGETGNCRYGRRGFAKRDLLHPTKAGKPCLRQVNPEEILREAKNDRCLQLAVNNPEPLFLYCLNAIALIPENFLALDKISCYNG